MHLTALAAAYQNKHKVECSLVRDIAFGAG